MRSLPTHEPPGETLPVPAVLPERHVDTVIDIARLLSACELRALGLRLMRSGAPFGWLGAILVVDSNRIPDRDA